jgi:NADH-quinone oxidoreductase subunit L
MEHLLQLFVYLPLLAFFASLFIDGKKEKTLANIAIFSIGIHSVILLIIIVLWMMNNSTTIDYKHLVLYKSEKFEFFINFYFDITTAVYALVG